MMTKNKSKGWAKCKVLLILPLFCFLVQAFADSRTITASNPDDSAKVEEVQKDSKKVAKEIAEITIKIKELRIKLDKTKDAALRRKIKEKIVVLEKEYQKANKRSNGDPIHADSTYIKKLAQEEKNLRQVLSETKDPDLKNKLKEKLAQIIEERKKPKYKEYVKVPPVGSESWNQMKKELKMKISKTKDPKNKMALKKKYEKMLQFEKEKTKK